MTTYHLRPASGWLNDPNGMVHRDGRWHVFFQHNPAGPVHDRIAWGHASSPDLVRWSEHPVAFAPAPGGPDSFGCWSGVFVPGLERPAVVYSGVTGAAGPSTVCLRWGSPDLVEWSRPEVVATTPEVDEVAVMRDPYVVSRGGRRWALLGAGLSEGTPAVLLYDCSDMQQWRYAGVWLTGKDDVLSGAAPADVWECPQLVPVGDRWALVLSLHDGGTLGQVVACLGDLVDGAGGAPAFVPERLEVIDAGSVFYAPQAVLDGQGDGLLLMGWVREEDRDPAEQDHAGCLSLPRRLVLDDDGGLAVMLDERVAALVGCAPSAQLPTGGHRLDGAARVLLGDGGTRLEHPRLPALDCPPGTQIWVDGPVLEVYPGDGSVPVTHRDAVAWTLEVGEGSTAWWDRVQVAGR